MKYSGKVKNHRKNKKTPTNQKNYLKYQENYRENNENNGDNQ